MAFSTLDSAIDDYHRARSQGMVKEIISRFTGQSNALLSFEDVRQKLKAKASSDRGLQDVPLNAIIGSVNRYDDFTRDFLPRKAISAERWARVEMAVTELVGLEPVELYKIGEVYFVKDGNHRCSVARQMGASHIHAYVTEIQTRVSLTPDTRPEDLILKAEYAGFLEKTNLDDLRPDAELTVTAPGQYEKLAEHIQVHQYFMGLDLKRDIPYEEAVTHWYDTVYQPIRQVIWSQGILKHFPGRTEADLYLWIAEHRASLEEAYGQNIRPERIVGDLAERFSPRPHRVVGRLGSKLLENLLPEPLEPGPVVGGWRQEKGGDLGQSTLFTDILVPISGRENGWNGLQIALQVASQEDGYIYGLHVRQPHMPDEKVLEIEREFYRRCQEAARPARLVFTQGDITKKICDHGRWSDLMVVNLAYPPSSQPLVAFSSGFRKLVQRSAQPLLAVPYSTENKPIRSALLAYDGSPKAEEALFIATYLVLRWQIQLTVLSVLDKEQTAVEALQAAEAYLEEHGVRARLLRKAGAVADIILGTADEYQIDLLMMGGYGHNPMLDVVLGSKVDRVLRGTRHPVLICR
jgi:nucleotide-binding universal stress UspA family protein